MLKASVDVMNINRCAWWPKCKRVSTCKCTKNAGIDVDGALLPLAMPGPAPARHECRSTRGCPWGGRGL